MGLLSDSGAASALAVLLIAMAVLCVLTVVGIPYLTRLLFRHRLEVIRDDCMDEVLRGHLRLLPSVERFLLATEIGSPRPRLLNLPRIFAAYKAMTGLGVDLQQVAPVPSYDELQADEQRIMRWLDYRLCTAYHSYLKWGSPMSWVLQLVVPLISSINPQSRIVEAEDALPALARETLQRTGAATSRRPLAGRLNAIR